MTKNAKTWRQISDDPNAQTVRRFLRETLLEARKGCILDRTEFLRDFVRDHSVLDIGVVGHTIDRSHDPKWKHNLLKEAATSVVGVDILEEPVRELCARGYDVRLVDATSDADLGERFSRVVIGDVIEHVDSAVSLLRFAKRHLKPGGRILATTPNPFFVGSFVRVMREGVSVENAEHVSWMTPTMALEVAQRADLGLFGYWHTQGTGSTFLRKLAVKGLKLAGKLENELFAGAFCFVFDAKQSSLS